MKPSIHPSTHSFNSTQFLGKTVFYTIKFSNTFDSKIITQAFDVVFIAKIFR